ncbi:MAG: DUF192 domain-containing protein [Hyphomonadaceae bacterium]|nr:DUF192 domain-containing protein [Hyphomonadaceae bacterium]
MLANLLRAGGLVLALLGAACAQPATTAQPAPAPVTAQSEFEEVVVETANGPVRFEVEIADTEAERAQGLMYRQTLPGYRGMLFDFQQPRPVSFWMRNTVLSLDIIFIGVDGRILNIADHATPMSDAPIPSDGVTRGVLEIGAGRAEALGIRPGDRVRHRIFPADEQAD